MMLQSKRGHNYIYNVTFAAQQRQLIVATPKWHRLAHSMHRGLPVDTNGYNLAYPFYQPSHIPMGGHPCGNLLNVLRLKGLLASAFP